MKVLLSAFAIAPNKGSEPGVGWNWAVNMSRYHEVFVITRLENKREIERYQREHEVPFRVFYFGIPVFEKTGKFPFKQSLYAMAWQRQVVKYAKKLHEKEQFEIIHHCTYATFKFPTRLYKLNLPLVVGPLGGVNVPLILVKINSMLKENLQSILEIFRLMHRVILVAL